VVLVHIDKLIPEILNSQTLFVHQVETELSVLHPGILVTVKPVNESGIFKSTFIFVRLTLHVFSNLIVYVNLSHIDQVDLSTDIYSFKRA
jgi:hypothetical protein